MGREVRMVPADWQHPMREDGGFIPLFGGSYQERAEEWREEGEHWQKGLRRNYGDGPKWKPIEAELAEMRYTDYAGAIPSPNDYMPDWPDEQRTHYMMYEDTSEGTPISPAFATPEELARWLADNNASAFAGETATYEQWLRMITGTGWAPSMVICGSLAYSGVAALSDSK
jgi:hypothetical protein